MSLLILEALGALALLLFIVWWTMFSGRRGGERRDEADPDEPGVDELAGTDSRSQAPADRERSDRSGGT